MEPFIANNNNNNNNSNNNNNNNNNNNKNNNKILYLNTIKVAIYHVLSTCLFLAFWPLQGYMTIITTLIRFCVLYWVKLQDDYGPLQLEMNRQQIKMKLYNYRNNVYICHIKIYSVHVPVHVQYM